MGKRLLGYRWPRRRPIFLQMPCEPPPDCAQHFCESLIAIGRVVSESIQDTHRQTHTQTDTHTDRHTHKHRQTFYFILAVPRMRCNACIVMLCESDACSFASSLSYCFYVFCFIFSSCYYLFKFLFSFKLISSFPFFTCRFLFSFRILKFFSVQFQKLFFFTIHSLSRFFFFQVLFKPITENSLVKYTRFHIKN